MFIRSYGSPLVAAMVLSSLGCVGTGTISGLTTVNGGESGTGGPSGSSGPGGDSGSGDPTGGAGGGGGGTAGGGGSGGRGGSGTGGISGSPDGGGGNLPDVPHMVRACPTGMTTNVGVWEAITPPQLLPLMGGGPMAVAVDPQDPATIYTAGGSLPCCSIGSKGLYKSTDCGATWKKLNTGRNAAALDSGWQWGQIVIDPVDPKVMYVPNGYGNPPTMFKSTNGGVDWDPLWPSGSEVAKTVQFNFANGLSMDPTNPKHLLVSFHANCLGAYAPGCLAESMDSGATWKLFKTPSGTPWSEGNFAILMGPNQMFFSNPFDSLWLSGNGGANWTKVAPDSHGQMYKAKDGSLYIGSRQQRVLRSTDNGATWKTIPGSPWDTESLIGDGTNIFASGGADNSGKPFWTTKESDPTTWTKVNTPTIARGANCLAYDPDHHILYASTQAAGLWRVVTK